MPRGPRIEYAGAVYHVMCRGDRGEDVFSDADDRRCFLATLAAACLRTGWRVHAYVLMDNHYHLLLETPEPNLVAGMRWLQGTYTQRYNRRHALGGHLFQGRYKALLVEAGVGEYFAVVSDYIHLNPARARYVNADQGGLGGYPWSSYPAFLAPARRPGWLTVDRTFECLGVSDHARGRRVFREHLRMRVEEVLASDRPWQADRHWARIRRGWYIGSPTFKEYLLERIELQGKRQSFSGEAVQEHDERDAERVVRVGLAHLGLSEETLRTLPKGADEKALVAWLVRRRTAVPNAWIAHRLRMGRADCLSLYTRRIDAATDRVRAKARDRLARITRFRD